MQSDPNQARKRSEAAKKGARTRAAQKHAREQWEQRDAQPTCEDVLRELLAVYDAAYPKGGQRLPGPRMYVATEKARHFLKGMRSDA